MTLKEGRSRSRWGVLSMYMPKQFICHQCQRKEWERTLLILGLVLIAAALICWLYGLPFT